MSITWDILRLEREAIALAARIAALEGRGAAVEQQGAGLWNTARSPVPAVTLTSSSNPSGGGSVTFTATVATIASYPQPTGTVQFFQDGVSGSTQSLSNVGGVATATWVDSGLGSSGTYTMLAAYSGDAAYLSAPSAPLSQVVSSGITWDGCGGVPTTLYAHDSRYGVTALTYDSGTTSFIGCKGGINYVTTGSCSNVSGIAIKYQFFSRVNVKMSWVYSGSGLFRCPVASTCGSTFNADDSTFGACWTNSSSSCGPVDATYSFNSFSAYGSYIYSPGDTLHLKETP